MTILLLSLSAYANDCLTPTHAADLAAKVNAAEQAYATFEVETFAASLDEAALMLPCLAEVVPADVSAHYLRVLGLRYFIERDPSNADLAFAASRSIAPDYSFPESLIPPSHSIRTHYTAFDISTASAVRIAQPRTDSLVFNGSPTPTPAARPAWPAIVQVLDATGAVATTRYVLPGDPLPPYDAIPFLVDAAGTHRPLSPKVPLLIGAGLAGVGSGALYILSAASARNFEVYREDDSLSNLELLRSQTNGLAYGSIGAGVLAIGCAVGGVFVGKW